mmetsp:Transcript_30510/g.64218  ORF Transcript_30510/g.64218 Transcript_30510/m.64218 type:complete len:81 (+) Transcript_30510:94-336(+)
MASPSFPPPPYLLPTKRGSRAWMREAAMHGSHVNATAMRKCLWLQPLKKENHACASTCAFSEMSERSRSEGRHMHESAES